MPFGRHRPSQGRARYQRVVERMPKQKALGVIAHGLLVISDHLLSGRVPYAELGTAPLDRPQVERQRWRSVEQLVTLGVKVTIEEGIAAAQAGYFRSRPFACRVSSLANRMLINCVVDSIGPVRSGIWTRGF